MKTARIIGGSALTTGIANQLIEGNKQEVGGKIVREGKVFKVLTQHLGKTAIAICVLSVIGGGLFCLYNYFKPEEICKIPED